MSHKFATELAERLYNDSLNGLHDDGLGDTIDFGWYGLFISERAIIREDNYGFVSITVFETMEETEENWEDIQEDWETFCCEPDPGIDYEDVYPEYGSYIESDLYDFEY